MMLELEMVLELELELELVSIGRSVAMFNAEYGWDEKISRVGELLSMKCLEEHVPMVGRERERETER